MTSTVRSERSEEAAETRTAPVVATAEVVTAERLSPAFVRVGLGAPEFAELAVLGYDTRIKLIFPGPGGTLPELPAEPERWYEAWSALPEGERPPMRTYTVRDVVDRADSRLLVVDLVVHEPAEQAGPACRWALTARPGDRVQVVAPRRGAGEYGGTEFDPGRSRRVLLTGDETALPAIARTLLDLPAGLTGAAVIEVPTAQDVVAVTAPEGFEIDWVIRDGAGYGRRLVDRVRDRLGLGPLTDAGPGMAGAAPAPAEGDVEVWETPTYSAAGEDLEAQLQRRTLGGDLADLYAWIAGESWAVKALRRALVGEIGLDRAQVAFMGYWREGVAMRG